MDRVKQLEDANNMGTLRFPSATVSLPPTSSSPPSASAVQQNVLAVFNGRMKISWQEFSSAVEAFLNTTADSLEKIKYLVTDNEGVADKALWEHLLKWFTPLYPNGTTIEVNQKNKEEPAYLFNDLVNICSPNWFFGWMSPVDRNKMLLGQPSGTFLFRFSSFPGWYTLSVSNEGQVGHWRIKSVKGPNWENFWIDERKYDSLTNIIETHLLEPLKVNTDRSTQRPVRLETPCERKPKKDETLYTAFE